MANQFFVQPASALPGLQMAFQGQREYFAEKEKQQKEEELKRLYTEGSPEEVGKFFLENPDMAEAYSKAKATTDVLKREEDVKQAWDIITGKKSPKDVLTERIGEIEARGGNASDSKRLLALEEQYPGIIQREAIGVLARYDRDALKTYWNTIFGSGDGAPKPTPTDIDDFVKDAETVYLDEHPNATEADLAKMRNEARLQFKRAQAEEKRRNRLAEKQVDLEFAGKLSRATEMGKRLAEIATAKQLIHAKGELTPEEKKAQAKQAVEGYLAKLAKLYTDLNNVKGMINAKNGTLENIWAAIKTSTVGQGVSRWLGTNEQKARDTIRSIKPLLLQEIRRATDMKARGMDSEKELDFYMQAATNEKTDFEANMAALALLSERFGDGTIAKELSPYIDPSVYDSVRRGGEHARKMGLAQMKAEEYLRANYKQRPELLQMFKNRYGYIPKGIEQ